MSKHGRKQQPALPHGTMPFGTWSTITWRSLDRDLAHSHHRNRALQRISPIRFGCGSAQPPSIPTQHSVWSRRNTVVVCGMRIHDAPRPWQRWCSWWYGQQCGKRLSASFTPTACARVARGGLKRFFSMTGRREANWLDKENEWMYYRSRWVVSDADHGLYSGNLILAEELTLCQTLRQPRH